MANRNNLLLLFDRPSEPAFTTKGYGSSHKKAVFDLPDTYLTDRYKPIGIALANRFSEDASERIPVRAINLPDISLPSQLSRQEDFSVFIPWHRTMAGKLIEIFMNMKNLDELQSCAVFCRDRINPCMYNYALSVAILHRPDTNTLIPPPFVETFPEKFLDSSVFEQAREEARVVPEELRRRIVIPKDFTASDLELEHRIAYWREDIGLNLHHWHWHLVYPISGDRRIVAKDRRGELFYYMHQQVIARYNFERLSNKLPRVKRFNNFREPILNGYFPKLTRLNSSRGWPPRQDNVAWSDLNRVTDQIILRIADLERSRDRIYTAIHQGFIIDRRGEQVPLTEQEGIDVLGNIIEASILSANPEYYGNMHNTGHLFTALVHDPQNLHLEGFGVMADSSTAMRDPVFYLWHGFIDDLFQEFKESLPRYTPAVLDYRGVTVTGISIGSDNIFNTYWQQSDIDISRGLDFAPPGDVIIQFTHLQYRPFTYNITVNNTGSSRFGTVRIFLAPKFDERGLPWAFRDQRTMFIELDKFVVTLQQGENNIRRRHDESSVTIPFERTFRSLENRPPAGTPARTEFNFCGCGLPQHLLIPKGAPEGMPCELFVMVSNYFQDRVEQEEGGTCSDASSYCGVRDRLYPDRRSMGYPFDRSPRRGVRTLQDFLTPNMFVQDVTIRYTNVTEVNPITALNSRSI